MLIEKPLLFRSVEHHPDTKIRRDILEPVRHMRGSEEKVSWADRGYPVLHPVMRGPSGYHVEFVTLMRHLRPICGLGGEPDFEIAVTKDFGRTPRRPGQRERDGKRRWWWRAIHGSSSLTATVRHQKPRPSAPRTSGATKALANVTSAK